MYAELLFYIYRKFQVAPMHDTNIEFCVSTLTCFLVLVIKGTQTQAQSHIHTEQTLKMWFSDLGDIITCKSTKISISKIWTKAYIFPTITWVRESNKWMWQLFCIFNAKRILITNSSQLWYEHSIKHGNIQSAKKVFEHLR